MTREMHSLWLDFASDHRQWHWRHLVLRLYRLAQEFAWPFLYDAPKVQQSNLPAIPV